MVLCILGLQHKTIVANVYFRSYRIQEVLEFVLGHGWRCGFMVLCILGIAAQTIVANVYLQMLLWFLPCRAMQVGLWSIVALRYGVTARHLVFVGAAQAIL